MYHSHKHVEVFPGAIANVSPDCDQETLDALSRVAEAAYNMNHKRPTAKIIAKMPMERTVLTGNGEVWEYSFPGGKIFWCFKYHVLIE